MIAEKFALGCPEATVDFSIQKAKHPNVKNTHFDE